MTTADTRHVDGLAALRDGRYVETPSRRPLLLRLDSGGAGDHRRDTGSPRPVRGCRSLPRRRGLPAQLRARDTTSRLGCDRDDLQAADLTEEARRVVGFFAALPDRTDAGRPYRDLRTVARLSPDLAESYALEVLRSLRATLSTAARPPRELARSGPATRSRTRCGSRRSRSGTRRSALARLVCAATREPLGLAGQPAPLALNTYPEEGRGCGCGSPRATGSRQERAPGG